jgi:hypothetical protein
MMPSPPITHVLDIETTQRADLVQRSQLARAERSWEHELVCATVLVADERTDSIRLSSSSSAGGEAELLTWIDRALGDPGASVLVTFNGMGWDLPALRSRAMANWCFDLPNLRGWTTPSACHRDLMLELSADGAGRWPSLEGACGAIGVPAKTLPRTARRGPEAVQLGNQCDVVATYLLHLHLRAFRDGDVATLARGWLALAAALGGEHAPEHLQPYATHPHLAAARALVDRTSNSRGGSA